jgi:hypothetical protein
MPTAQTLGNASAVPGDAQAVISRLEALELARKVEREARAAAAKEQADPRESVEGFLAWYSSQQADLQQRCDQLAPAPDAAPCGSASAPGAPVQQADALLAEVADLERALADASYFLPSYDLRSASAAAQGLRAQLEAVKCQLAPKRKFAFASKRVSRVKADEQQQPQQPAVDDAAHGVGPDGSCLPQQAPAGGCPSTSSSRSQAAAAPAPVAALSQQDAELIAAGHGVSGLRGVTLVKHAADLAGDAYVVHDCHGCTILLLGALRALRVRGVSACTLAAGPVGGATFVVDAQQSRLYIASQQVGMRASGAAVMGAIGRGPAGCLPACLPA